MDTCCSLVDTDTNYDDIAQEGRDAEEKYFDESDDGESTEQPLSALAPDEYDYWSGCGDFGAENLKWYDVSWSLEDMSSLVSRFSGDFWILTMLVVVLV